MVVGYTASDKAIPVDAKINQSILPAFFLDGRKNINQNLGAVFDASTIFVCSVVIKRVKEKGQRIVMSRMRLDNIYSCDKGDGPSLESLPRS